MPNENHNARINPSIFNSGYWELIGIKFFLTNFLKTKKISGTIIDIGAQYKPYYPLYSKYFDKIIIQDIVDVSDVDICCDAHDMPLEDASVDFCLLTQVLEHSQDFQGIISECFRILKPGGYILITVPSMFPIHGYPFDCWRFMPDGLKFSLSSFQDVKISPLMSFSQCWLVTNQYFIFSLLEKFFGAGFIINKVIKPMVALTFNLVLKLINPFEKLLFKKNFDAFQISIGAYGKK